MYAGLAPESALALYAVITYMDSIEGVWFPEGGIHAVPTIMAAGRREGRRELPLRRCRGGGAALADGTGCRCADGIRRADRRRRRGLHC